MMRLTLWALCVLALATPAWAAASLSYSGADLSSGTGTMTITCSDAGVGNLWALDIKRISFSYLVILSRFDDLKDGGNYNYGENNYDWGYGFFVCHKKPGTSGSDTYTGTFTQLHKDADYYSFKMTVVKTTSGVEQWQQVTTYTIHPSADTGTQFTASSTVTNTSGQDQTSGAWKSYVFSAYMTLNADPYNYNQGGRLSAYLGSLPAYCKQLQYADGPDAIWRITDNLNSANPERQVGQAAWGQGEVMNNSVTQGQGLTAGRTFKLTTDINNNSTATTQFSALLRTYPAYPVLYYVNPYDWGYPATWKAGDSYTKNYALNINITSNAPPVADAGDDQTVHDTDRSGSETVTLDGSGSSDPDGSIVSYAWKEGTSQIATGATAQVSLAVGSHTIALVVTDNVGATDDDTVVITVNGMPTADAGDDQTVVDSDENGSHLVTLDGTGSSDDGGITSYVWKEGTSEIATGSTAQVTLTNGIHDISLTVTDGSSYSDLDFMRVWIMPQPDYYVDQSHPSASDSNPGTEALPWKTIAKGVTSRQPGQVVVVKEGVYRESVSLPVSGSSGSPITLMGYPFHRVVISGADAITGWTQCTQQQAKGNPNYANIYYVDIAWKPTRLVQDGYDLNYSRQPANGKWICTGGTTTTLVDTNHLTQADDYWNGATVSLYDQSAGVTYERTVTDFDSASSTLTVNAVWYQDRTPEAGVDSYYMANAVQIIDDAGQWAVEDLGGGTYRVYAWAYDGGDPDGNLMEGSKRSSCIYLGTRGYWTIDNFEIRHTTLAWGYGIGNTNSGGLGHNLIQNCSIHHNDGYAIQAGYNHASVVRRNYLCFNRYGVATTCSNDMVVEENEVGWNTEDGVRPTGPTSGWADGVIVRKNYVHDHIGQNHPDNMQSFNNVSNLTMEDNFCISAGQNYMGSGVDGITFRNNVVVGSLAVSVIYGSGCQNCTSENNTVLFSGYTLFSAPTDGGHYKNNICIQGGSSRIWAVANVAGYSSDYNCFHIRPGYTYSPVVWNSQWNWTFAQYQSGSGQDAHSYHADPLLANAPTHFVKTNETKQKDFTSTKVYMSTTDAGFFAVDDRIEIDWDGVMRTVTAKGSDYIEFSPGDAKFMDKAWQVANWKDKTSTALDVTLDENSPAKGTADDSGDMGSSIDIYDYMAGDFNGDGVRDIPVWPPQE